ncbi:MAG: exopolysaccharide biosynthesis polyprenyl glycosylphosphotransferase [Solirubrobacterales bacterium]|nr:exopolysaccharide biosynthesis polyprenyl glycosylphosphotransferase [Solirubrobacterales bacterium]
MTPPPAASHADQSGPLALGRSTGDLVSGLAARLIAPRYWAQFCLLLDVVILYLASTAALFGAPTSGGSAARWLAAIFPPLTLAMMHSRRSPDERLHGSSLETATRILSVVSISTMLTIAAGSVIGANHEVSLALRLWLFSGVYLTVARLVLLSIRRQATRTGTLATPTLIVGAGLVGEHLVKRLVTDPSYGLRPVGYLDSDPLAGAERAAPSGLPVLGDPDDLMQAIERTGARRVILAFSSLPDHELVDKVEQCDRLGVEVSLVPRFFESINERATLDHVGGLPLLNLRPTNPRGWQFAVKHAFDRGFAALAVLVLSPLLLGCAVAVRLSSPGPIFFRQRRVGRDGCEFTMLKFRTMRGDPSADGEADARWAAKIRGEAGPVATRVPDRVTPPGRIMRVLSLDELPQLLNVLRGEMSIVGPRPERVGYVREFERVVRRYGDRHRVKSGMTGWAQVSGLRGETSIADRVEWDNYYIQNWSLWLDLRIIAMTVLEVVQSRGSAYAEVMRHPDRTR